MQFIFSLDSIITRKSKISSEEYNNALQHCLSCGHEVLFVTNKPLFNVLNTLPIKNLKINLYDQYNHFINHNKNAAFFSKGKSKFNKSKNQPKQNADKSSSILMTEQPSSPLMVFSLYKDSGTFNFLSPTLDRWKKMKQHGFIQDSYVIFSSDWRDRNMILRAKESVCIAKECDAQDYAHWQIQEQELAPTFIKMSEKYCETYI